MGAFSILVVDDNFAIARTTAYLFSRAGYDCRIAGDGVETLEKIAEKKPDLVLLDVQMPRMDGVETCRQIRANPDYGDIRIIILTALGDEDDVARARGAGADECLAKPIDPPDLLRKVEEILRPAESR
jgi:CheY-like chemotaxis protein